MKNKLPVKCKAYKGQWCRAVEEVFQFENPTSKGLVVGVVVNTRTGDRGFGLSYRFKANTNKFVWLNFCPFCGSSVQKRTSRKWMSNIKCNT